MMISWPLGSRYGHNNSECKLCYSMEMKNLLFIRFISTFKVALCDLGLGALKTADIKHLSDVSLPLEPVWIFCMSPWSVAACCHTLLYTIRFLISHCQQLLCSLHLCLCEGLDLRAQITISVHLKWLSFPLSPFTERKYSPGNKDNAHVHT